MDGPSEGSFVVEESAPSDVAAEQVEEVEANAVSVQTRLRLAPPPIRKKDVPSVSLLKQCPKSAQKVSVVARVCLLLLPWPRSCMAMGLGAPHDAFPPIGRRGMACSVVARSPSCLSSRGVAPFRPAPSSFSCHHPLVYLSRPSHRRARAATAEDVQRDLHRRRRATRAQARPPTSSPYLTPHHLTHVIVQQWWHQRRSVCFAASHRAQGPPRGRHQTTGKRVLFTSQKKGRREKTVTDSCCHSTSPTPT